MPDVTVNLKINLSGDAIDKLNQMAAASDKAAESQKKFNEEANKPIIDKRVSTEATRKPNHEAFNPQKMLQEGAVSAAGGEGSRGMQLAGSIGNVWMQATEAMGRVGKAANILQDGLATNAQKFTALAEEFVPGARNLRLFAEAVTGTTEALARHARDTEVALAERSSRGRFIYQEVAYKQEATQAQSRAVSFGTYGLERYAGGGFDQSTYGGRIGLQDYETRLAARDALVQAQRQKSAAAANLESTQGRLGMASYKVSSSTDRMNRADSDHSRLAKYEDDYGIRAKAARDEALRRGQVAQADLNNALVQQEREILNVREARVKAAEAEGAVAKANVEIQKAELAIHERRAARMSEGQTRLGSMTRGQFALGRDMALALKTVGIDNASAEMINLARSVDPHGVNQMAENAGAARAKQLADLGFEGYKDDYAEGRTLAGERGAAINIKADTRIKIDMNEQAVAKAIAEAVGEQLDIFMRRIEAQVRSDVSGAKRGQYIKKNQES